MGENKKEKTIPIDSEFKKASEPLLKYLNKNHHPHVVVIVTPTSIELLEGICSIPKIYDFIKD